MVLIWRHATMNQASRAPCIQFSVGFTFVQSKMFKDSDLADVFLLMKPHQHMLVLSTVIAILWWLEVEQFECMAIWIYCDLNGCGVCIQNHPFRAVKGGSSRRLDLKQICNIFASFHDDEDDDSRQANLQYFSHLLTPMPSKQTFSSKTRGLTAKHLQTRFSWLNSALRGEEAVYLVSVRQQWLLLYHTESVYQSTS